MASTTNLHEKQRLATRQALRQAALTRFAKDGFDAVSVADIAADAGVTERTFYRHFKTKEGVLFEDYETRLEWLHAALELRPRDEPLLDGIAAAVRMFPDSTEVVRQTALLRGDLIPRDLVEISLQRIQAQFAAEIRTHVLRRLDGHPQADLLAAVAGNAIAGALIAVVDTWGLQNAQTEAQLEHLLDVTMNFLRSGFETAGLAATKRPRREPRARRSRSYSRG